MGPLSVMLTACVAAATARASIQRPPPTLDDLWSGAARFNQTRTFVVNAPPLPKVDAGTRVVVVNGSWYLFGRTDTAASGACKQGVIAVNVRVSTDRGATWGPPHPVAIPDEHTVCMYADGSAFWDAEEGTWHYIVQQLDVGGAGGWSMSHFSLRAPSPFGAWVPDAANPVVKGGQLWSRICAGPGKHCPVGTVDEGTPEIVAKANGSFYVTFHGYDYKTKQASRGVAATPDFRTWSVEGEGLPNDAIFSAADCNGWNVSWATGGCIGPGEASVLRAPSGYMYQVIEAADVALTCDLTRDVQWWPLGLVRSKTWAPSTRWEQMAHTPLVGGPTGREPHVGCSIQYNSLWQDGEGGSTFFAFWDVSFYPATPGTPSQRWHVYELVWGDGATYPIMWPGPPQAPSPPPPPPPDCSTEARCKATCSGFVTCPSDGEFYCCADQVHCGGTHDCAGTPGLHFCACGKGSGGA